MSLMDFFQKLDLCLAYSSKTGIQNIYGPWMILHSLDCLGRVQPQFLPTREKGTREDTKVDK